MQKKRVSFDADLGPAIAELKKLHHALLKYCETNKQETVHRPGLDAAYNTVISVVPAGRRREMGWYHLKMWERKSEELLHKIDSEFSPNRYHEIFIAGEALSWPLEDIVLLMMHQVAHQASSMTSDKSYHAEWLPIWMQRLFGFSRDAWSRDEVMGWTNLDKTKARHAMKVVKGFADQLDETAFDLFRITPRTVHLATGRMYLWHCDGCPRPIKVRTGGVLMASCDRCGKPLLLRGAPSAFLNRVPEERRA